MMEKRAIFLDRRAMQRCSSQSRIIPPKVLLFNSQLYHFLEDLEKQAAANSRNGVHGRTGRNTPNDASPTNKNPNALYIIRHHH